MQEAPTRTRPETDTSCPTCGAPAERGQLICLECGSRIALAYRRPPSWHLPAAIVAVIVLAAAAGLYFGIDALTDDADQEVAARPAPPQPAAPDGGDAGVDNNAKGGEDSTSAAGGEKSGSGQKSGAGNKPAKEKAGRESSGAVGGATKAPSVGAGGVRSWPEGEDAFTVVILSTGDRRSARAFAGGAAKGGVRAGVLRADDYPALFASTGFFIVFSGVYPNQAKADKAAARLAPRFKGAYPQFVDGSKAKEAGAGKSG